MVLDGTPEGKGRARFRAFTTKSGHAIASAYTPANTKKFEGRLRKAALDAMNGRPPLEGALAVRVVATFPVPVSYSKRKQHEAMTGILRPAKKPDADNILKVLDACNEVVFRDDAQIVDAQITKVYGARPSLRIEVFPVTPREPADLLFAPPLQEAAE